VSPVFQLNGPTTTVSLTEGTSEEIAKIGAVEESQTEPDSLSGSLRFEGLTPNQACPAHSWHQLELKAKSWNQRLIASVGAHGNFSFPPVRPGDYQMAFHETMHGTAYIKTFEVDGKSADPANFAVLPKKSTRIEAVFSNDPSDAKGHLRGGLHGPTSFFA
jgi:hypothetical protein